MEKLFVPYEIALQLKEKGFNEPCFGVYTFSNLPAKRVSGVHINDLTIHGNPSPTSAPLYQQCTDWLREKYNLHIDIEQGYYPTLWKEFEVEGKNNGADQIEIKSPIEGYYDYYEALNKAIIEALKLVK